VQRSSEESLVRTKDGAVTLELIEETFQKNYKGETVNSI